MTEMPPPSPEQLREIFTYDPETGSLRWKISPRNGIRPGDEAGSFRIKGHKVVGISGKSYQLSHIAWAIQTDAWPTKQIDHKLTYGSKADNRWDNLRLATNQQNGRNRRRQKNNKSGFTGVFWHKGIQKWCAQITVDARHIALGSFDDVGNAISARKAAEQVYFGEYAPT